MQVIAGTMNPVHLSEMAETDMNGKLYVRSDNSSNHSGGKHYSRCQTIC